MGKHKGKKGRKKQTLTEFFENVFVPQHLHAKGLDPKTETSYRETMAHWEDITGDPPLKKIDGNKSMVAMFMTELSKKRGKKGQTMARSSLAKHATQLKTVFKKAGPESNDNPEGNDVIDRIPFVPMAKVDKTDAEKDWTVDEIRAMYDACDEITLPVIEDIPPPDFWKCLLVVGFYCGLRITPLMSFEFSMIEGQTLRIPGRINKNKKPIAKYLPKEALEHIERMRRPGRTVVLGYPRWPKSKSTTYKQFNKILDGAAISPARRWKYHSLRHTYLNHYTIASVEHEEAMRAAQRSAGHASVDVTKTSYLSGRLKHRLEALAVDRFPSPCGAAAAAREAAP